MRSKYKPKHFLRTSKLPPSLASMDHSPRRSRKPPTPTPPPAKSSDNTLSTFIVHNDGDGGGENLSGDDESLPPLLKRVPKDFGGAGSFDFDAETSDGISGTFIVKPDDHRNSITSYQYSSSSSAEPHSVRRCRNTAFSSASRTEGNPRTLKTKEEVEDDDDEGDYGTFVVKKGRNDVVEDEEEEEEGEEFGTFVVRKTARKRREKESEEVSGTFVRKTSGGSGGGGGSTMSRAVASMQAVGELGFGGRNKKSAGGSVQLEDGSGHVRQLQSRMSSSSISEFIAREDPSSKYELLHELGELHDSD